MFLHRMKKCALSTVMLATIVGLSLPVSATLIGDTITIESSANAPLDTWTDSVLVGGGVELSTGDGSNHALGGPTFPHLFTLGDSYDIGANSITINFAALGSAAGFAYAFTSIFSDFDWTDMPGSLQSVVISAGATGLVASNISAVHAGGFTFQGTVDLVNGANFTLDLTAVHNVPVPAPMTLPILLAGLFGLTAYVRRKRLI